MLPSDWPVEVPTTKSRARRRSTFIDAAASSLDHMRAPVPRWFVDLTNLHELAAHAAIAAFSSKDFGRLHRSTSILSIKNLRHKE